MQADRKLSIQTRKQILRQGKRQTNSQTEEQLDIQSGREKGSRSYGEIFILNQEKGETFCRFYSNHFI